MLWDGLYNVRDLGGLPTSSGTTQFGRFVRAPRVDDLTPLGWQQLVEDGVRTVLDLRNADEIGESSRPRVLNTHHLPIEDQSDPEFMAHWGNQLNSPFYYRDNLDRWPDKITAVFAAMATAQPGAVVFHCMHGRDRTGLIAAMLLDLIGVAPELIADDYEISIHALNARLAAADSPTEKPLAPADLGAVIVERRQYLLDFLAGLDTADYLRTHGLSAGQVQAVRDRRVDPALLLVDPGGKGTDAMFSAASWSMRASS